MEPLQITLTTAGLAIIATDGSAGFGPAQIAQVGLTDTAFTAASTLTAIPGEIKRLPVHGEASGGDQLHIVALDATADVYTYRGLGLYLDDGTLFATYSQTSPIAAKAEVSTTYVAIDVQLEAGQTANITFGDTSWINPPASATRQGVIELATATEAIAGTDPTRAITPETLAATIAALFPDGQNEHGYWEKRPNGWIDQTGIVEAGDPWSGAYPFPVPFTDFSTINIQATSRSNNSAATNGNKVEAEAISLTHFRVGSDDGGTSVFFRAKGK
jgi:hypothetical protein